MGEPLYQQKQEILHNINSIRFPLQLLDEMGIPTQKALQGTGLQLSDLRDTGRQLSVQQELLVFRNLQQLSADPLLGLKIGEQYHIAVFGLWGYTMQHAPTLADAVKLGIQYVELSFTHFRYSLQIIDEAGTELACLTISPQFTKFPTPELARLMIEREMSCIRTLFQQLMLKPMPITRIEMTHNETQFARAYQDFFNCPVSLGSRENRILFEASILGQPLPYACEDTCQSFSRQCESLLQKKSSQAHALPQQIKQLLLSRPGFMPGIEYVAERLGMSSRTLRRHLAEHSTSFRQMVQETRYQTAQSYLINSDIPLVQLATLLGYNEPASFSTAFKEWSGISPMSYRQQHQKPRL